MVHFNVRYYSSQTPVVLNESASNLFTSPKKFDKRNLGNPVFCPGISSPPYQVAILVVVGRGTKQPSKFSKVSLHYNWIRRQLEQNYAFHSHLVIVLFKGENEEKRCSGSVINSHYVLTAAHCFYSSSRLVTQLNIYWLKITWFDESREMFNASNATVFGGFHFKNYQYRYQSSTHKMAKKVGEYVTWMIPSIVPKLVIFKFYLINPVYSARKLPKWQFSKNQIWHWTGWVWT